MNMNAKVRALGLFASLVMAIRQPKSTEAGWESTLLVSNEESDQLLVFGVKEGASEEKGGKYDIPACSEGTFEAVFVDSGREWVRNIRRPLDGQEHWVVAIRCLEGPKPVSLMLGNRPLGRRVFVELPDGDRELIPGVRFSLDARTAFLFRLRVDPDPAGKSG